MDGEKREGGEKNRTQITVIAYHWPLVAALPNCNHDLIKLEIIPVLKT
jgi:hypothetical protein